MDLSHGMRYRKVLLTCETISSSGKIRVVRNVSWPLAIMVIAVVTVVGVVAVMDKDVTAVSSAILMLLIALGLAELREIKSNTNGSNNTLMEQNRKLMDELGQYRREAARMTDRAFESAPLAPHLAATPVALVPVVAPDPYDPTHAQAPTVQMPNVKP